MAPVTFHLIALKSDVTEAFFISSLQSLSPKQRPLFVGQCHHWIHTPHLSAETLVGSGAEVKKWDYLLIHEADKPDSLSLPSGLESIAADVWSVTAGVDDEQLSSYNQAQRTRLAEPAPPLLDGWNAIDHSGLDSVTPPDDLELSLGESSYSLGSRSDTSQPIVLKDFIRDFGERNSSSVCMFNLLSYFPDQRPRYFEYIAAFAASVGSNYGGTPIFAGLGGMYNWSSKITETEQNSAGKWEDCALVWYPSIWHFGKMLDDPAYADVDRRFKQGALRDNPILCCTEVDVKYED